MIAYLILAHQYPKQLNRLLQAIYHRANLYLIHVDRKSPQWIHKSVEDGLGGYVNVFIAESQKVTWGGYSMVEATLSGIRELLSRGDSWEWLINLSGQDFPLRSQRAIMDLLSNSRCSGYLEFAEQRKERPETLSRFKFFHLELGDRVIRLPIRRRFPSDVVPYIGSQWFILSRAVCESIIQSDNLNRYKSVFRHTLIPDESFFQTMILNSDYPESIISNDKRLIVWAPISRVKERPRVLTCEDLPLISNSDDFFARKFDETVDASVLDCLEASLRP